VYFLIDETGSVQETRIKENSGQAALDAAALAVSDVFRFSPALNRDERVAVWVSFPIVFQVRR
jgi:TonB family protein